MVVTSTGLTATVTATATTTFETGDGTSTIPASAGFTPLASIVAAAGGSFNFANFAADPHITAAPKTDSAKNALSRKVDCRYYENCYPLEINCIIRSENIITATEIIVAGDPVTSTVIASAVSSTSYLSSPFCHISAGPASLLAGTGHYSRSVYFVTAWLTLHHMCAQVATQTVTTTNTVTGSMAPHATAFQVCAANNVIPYFSPTAAWADAQFNGNLGVSAGADGTECCQLCALMGAVCQASAYTETTIGGSCAYFLSADANPVCVATTVAGIAEYQQGTTGNTYSFSNSNCGQLAVQAIT